jgi:hypothetical protein
MAEFGGTRCPVKAGRWPPPSATGGLDGAPRSAAVCHQGIDGEVARAAISSRSISANFGPLSTAQRRSHQNRLLYAPQRPRGGPLPADHYHRAHANLQEQIPSPRCSFHQLPIARPLAGRLSSRVTALAVAFPVTSVSSSRHAERRGQVAWFASCHRGWK